MKKVWKDGTRAMLFSPMDLLARLVAIVPPAHCRPAQVHAESGPAVPRSWQS